MGKSGRLLTFAEVLAVMSIINVDRRFPFAKQSLAGRNQSTAWHGIYVEVGLSHPGSLLALYQAPTDGVAWWPPSNIVITSPSKMLTALT